jgi:asparagine synthase (glutamine-hydrolysing)
LAQTIRALINEGAVAQSGLFESAVIARLVEDHIASRAENSRVLWQLLMLELAMVRLGVSA